MFNTLENDKPDSVFPAPRSLREAQVDDHLSNALALWVLGKPPQSDPFGGCSGEDCLHTLLLRATCGPSKLPMERRGLFTLFSKPIRFRTRYSFCGSNWRLATRLRSGLPDHYRTGTRLSLRSTPCFLLSGLSSPHGSTRSGAIIRPPERGQYTTFGQLFHSRRPEFQFLHPSVFCRVCGVY